MIQHDMWVEKYRPQTLDAYIGSAFLKEAAEKMLAEGTIPHLVFYGPPGTGKTTMGKILSRALQADLLYLNASDENSIDTIRTKVKNFVQTKGFENLKIVFLDEAGHLTTQAQAMMLNLMEEYSGHSRFILTTNHLHRLAPAILSRTQQFEVTPPDQKAVARHLYSILQQEQIECTPEDVKNMVLHYYPDIRQLIGAAQQFSQTGKLVVNHGQMVDSNWCPRIVEIVKSNSMLGEKIKGVRQVFADNKVRDFAPLYTYLFDQLLTLTKPAKLPEMIEAINDGQKADALVPDKELNAAATVVKIIQSL